MVFRHQHAPAPARGGRTDADLGGGGSGGLRRLAHRGHPVKAKHRALPGRAVERDVAPKQARQRARNLQPQAIATLRPGAAAIDLGKAVKNLLFQLGVDADPGVAHHQAPMRQRAVALALERHGHRSAGRELDRIAQQVEHDLAHPGRVGQHPRRQVGSQAQGQLQLLALSHGPQRAVALLHQRGHIDRLRLQPDLPGVQGRQIQQIVQNRQQMRRRLPCRVQLVALRRRQRAVEQQIEQAQHPIEWRAQFVAHIGQKQALGAIGLLGSGLGPLQLGVEPLQLRALTLLPPVPQPQASGGQQQQQHLQAHQQIEPALLLPHLGQLVLHQVRHEAVGG